MRAHPARYALGVIVSTCAGSHLRLWCWITSPGCMSAATMGVPVSVLISRPILPAGPSVGPRVPFGLPWPMVERPRPDSHRPSCLSRALGACLVGHHPPVGRAQVRLCCLGASHGAPHLRPDHASLTASK